MLIEASEVYFYMITFQTNKTDLYRCRDFIYILIAFLWLRDKVTLSNKEANSASGL